MSSGHSNDSDHVTELLQRADAGDGAAINELLPAVYEQLRRCAQQRMAEELGSPVREGG